MQISPNALYQADCLSLLERLESDSAKLVYLDPPFFIGDATFVLEGNNQNREVDFDGYLDWLSQIINQAYRVTAPAGNIIIHTEPRINSYIRLIAEDLFEKIEFTEIILRRPKRFASSQKPFDEHETLLVCRKSHESIWNPLTRPLDQQEIIARFRLTDSHGLFTTLDLTQPVDRPNLQYSWQGFTPPTGRSWTFSKEKIERLNLEGRIHISADGKRPYLKSYADEFAGTPIGTNWDDLQPLVLPSSKEKTGYAAQQTLALMERIIQISTNEGDLVVDPFFGSGTLLVAAQALGRKWIGSDINESAQEITKKRFENTGVISPEDYTIGNEHELSSFEVMRDVKYGGFVNKFRHQNIQFVLNEKIHIEETRHYEFKEVVGNNPIKAIENVADEYAIAFLNGEGGRIYWGVRNDDGVIVGVLLDYRQRDEVGKTISVKLSQIQPPVAPSSWRLEFHKVYKKRKPVENIFVVELIVPRSPNANILYATGKGDVFIKTDSGKKRLSFMEMQAEIAKRIASGDKV